jgi:Holliday junction resolvase RusA-like endonuclease
MDNRFVVEFFVPGVPRSAGSKSSYPNKKTGGTITAKAGKYEGTWSAEVKAFAQEAVGPHGQLLVGPVGVVCEFVLDRPGNSKHWRRVKGNQILRTDAPQFVTRKPDTGKLNRCIEDALTKVLWKDDAQVAVQVNVKRYADPGEKLGAWIRVYSLQ